MTQPDKPDPDTRRFVFVSDADLKCFVIVTDPVTGKRHRCGAPAVSAVEAWPFCALHLP